MRLAALSAVTVIAFALSPVPATGKSAPQPPNNTGSSSPLVRYAYFTSVDLFPTELRRVTDFPVSIREFEAGKESAVVFVGAIDSPGRDFSVSAVLRGPDGSRVELFKETKKYSAEVKWYPVRRMIAMNRLLPASGGKWTLELAIDGQPAGTYAFEVSADPILVAERAAQEKAVAEKAAADRLAAEKAAAEKAGAEKRIAQGTMQAPASSTGRGAGALFGRGVKVEFSGPAHLKFRIDGKEYALDDKGQLEASLSAAEHEIEIRGGGFRPLKEKLTLSADQKVVQHKLSPEDAAPPTIAVLEPKPSADPLIADDVRVKVEITAEGRLTGVRIMNGSRVVERLTPDPKVKPGETVVLQSMVRLVEGPNQITVEAEDESGKPAKQTVTIERERLVAVELKTEPGAKIVVNKREFTANGAGTLPLRLLPGEYEIEVSKHGFKPATERLTIARGQRLVERQIVLAIPSAPTIALIDPAPGTDPVLGDEAKLRVEIKGESRLTALRILKDGQVLQRVAPDTNQRAGQPWTIETTVRGLAEGDNAFSLEAEDENGRPGKRAIVIARERTVPVELKTEAFAKVVISRREFTTSATGTLMLRLLPGDYDLEISKAGFKPTTERVSVARGQAAIQRQISLALPAPPSIALLDPAPGADPVLGDEAKLRVEIKGEARLTTLRIVKDGQVLQRVAPDTQQRVGQPWVVESTVRGLADGDNTFTLEAEDENGRPAKRTITVARERHIAIELRGDPSSKVLVNGREFTLSPAGVLALRLLPGDYRIEATKAGFKPYSERLTVRRGQNATTHQLAFRRPDPPTLALLDPSDNAQVNSAAAIIKVEVRSAESRLAALKVSGLQEVTERPQPNAPIGEPWIAEAVVKLAKGPNDIVLEAVDEYGQKTTKNIRLVYVDRIAGVQPPQLPPAPPTRAMPRDYGRYHAVIIGNASYDTLQPLKTPGRDAKAVYDMLTREYGFNVANVRLLRDATRSKIIQTLYEFRQKLSEKDNFLLYYAGHGILDSDADRGYWLPVDAAQDAPDTWLSTADVTDALRAMKAKHVLVVADSCYSGAMRDVAVIPARQVDIDRLAGRRARTLLASGGVEPVADGGGGNHSVFAKAFLDALDGAKGAVLVSNLFAEIKRKVELNSDQRPLYSPIKLAGHDDGDFIFVRTAPVAPPVGGNAP